MAASAVFGAADQPHVEVLIGVDEDDPALLDYRAVVERLSWARVLLVESPAGSTVSETWNHLAAASKGHILLMGNDDQLYETAGWDACFRGIDRMYPDGVYVAWVNDGINGRKHCAFPAVSRRWYQVLGHFAPTCGFRFFYNDTWVYDIGHRVGRLHYVDNCMVRHLHHTTPGGVSDDVTARNRSSRQGVEDRNLWVDTDGERERLAGLLRESMESRIVVP